MLGQALHLLSKYTVKDHSRLRMSIRRMTRVSSKDSVHKRKPLLIVITAKSPFKKSISNEGPVRRRAFFSIGRYFTRRPLKKPALVVFCLILAVSPCSAVLTSSFVFDVSLLTSALSPVPLWLRLAGGTGGISLWRDMLVSFIELKNKRTGYLPGPLHLTFSSISSFPSSWLYSCDLGTRPCLFATLRILPKSFPAYHSFYSRHPASS